MFLKHGFLMAGLLLASAAAALSQERRVQQARELGRMEIGVTQVQEPASSPGRVSTTSDDESFGVQQLLRESSRRSSFSTYADIAALLTDNVGLTRDNRRGDALLQSTIGVGYRHPLPAGLKLDVGVSLSAFRYNSYPKLGFNSLDAAIGLSYRVTKLGGVDLNVGYSYNNLSDRSADTFFHNHAIELGAQKSIDLGGPHSVFAGVAAEIGFAVPRVSERNEYSAYVGYRLQAARRWDIDLFYRYTYYDYAEEDRGDHNQTVTLGSRYRFSDWLSVYATSYVVINNSSDHSFNYVAGTAGLGAGLKWSF